MQPLAADAGDLASQPPPARRAASDGGLAALCLLARLHHVAADPAALWHRLGLGASEAAGIDHLLTAAGHLGLRARRSRTSAERLALTPLPALASMVDGLVAVLAQCDGQRVLTQAFDGSGNESRPTIAPLADFAARWSGELILIASRASLAGDLARFDFSWFIPSLVKHRRLLVEVLVVSLFLQLFALVMPLFFQVVMDKVLVHRGVALR
ncbi:MAG: Toxin RTX-I translocation ATP-binding protein [Burkholderiaceae bacterium]|nr:Toxin RTX-I translocation ATP-binding protein [Burkholderiaceae bacterium]